MSLLLKCLEGKNKRDLQTELFNERLLPDLDGNVKCGNSLIGRDIYESAQGMIFEREEKLRINAFDWKTEFKPIMDQGGFDAVIGNPPYVRQESLGADKTYFQDHFKVYHGIADLYAYFIEQGVSLLREKGLFGYIVANKWMRANYGEPLRRWLKSQDILEIIDFGDLPVFKTATTYPCILVVSKSSKKASPAIHITQVKTLAFESLEHYVQENRYALDQETLDDGGWSLADGGTQKLLDKLKATGTPLGDYVKGNIYRGVLTGLNEAFVIDEETKDRLIAQDPKSAELIKPFLAGRDVKRYQTPKAEKYFIFTRRGINIKEYKAIEKHLLQFKERLMPRPKDWKNGEWKGRKPGAYQWHEIQDTIDYYREFEKPKIFWPEIASSARFAFDDASLYANNKVFMIPGGSYYLLGLLNSSLLKLFIHSVCTDLQGNSFNFSAVFVAKTPIRDIQFDNPTDKKLHDDLVKLVENILAFHKELKKPGIDSIQKRSIEQDIADTDRQIDALVYELYDLTPEERAILEGAA